MVINNLKYSAQTIAPNPKEIDYWIDLKEDPNGGIIKYYNGVTWDYLNQMDDQNAQIDDIKETLANIKINKVNDTQYQLIVDNKVVGTIDVPESKTYTFTNGTDGSFTVADGSNSQKVTIGKPATAGTADTALSVEWTNVNNKVTVSTTQDGLMSRTDKQNLNNLVNNTNNYQTGEQVDAKVASIVDSAPETLDTLNELATALGNDPNFATTVANQIGQKADKTVVTIQANGLMSSTDKQKLDSVETNANASADFNAVVSAQTLQDPEQEYITVSFTTQNTLTGTTTSNASGSTIYAASSTDMGYMTSAMYNTLMAIPTMQIVTALPASPDENTIYFVTGE